MSKAERRSAAIVLAFLAAGLAFAGRAKADPDPLKEAEARQRVAAEAAERDVREARDAAYKTARTEPAKALERIRNLLLLVDSNPDLPADRRDALTALLKRDLAQIERTSDASSAAAAAEASSGFHRVAPDPRPDDQKKVIHDAGSRIASAQEALHADAEMRAKKAEGFAKVMTSVDEASVPQATDYTFPPNWRELTALRSKRNQLTETERAILKALNAIISPEFKAERFAGVIDWFEKQTGQTIVLDKAAMADINVNAESTVNVTLNRVSTRTALKKVLADLGLTYVIKDETIVVTTPAKAKDMMTVRTYYIGDLMPQYDVRFGTAFTQAQAMAAVSQLVGTIKNNIDPDSWKDNGKDDGGTIVFDAAHMTLIVKQSAEMHMKMMQGFNP